MMQPFSNIWLILLSCGAVKTVYCSYTLKGVRYRSLPNVWSCETQCVQWKEIVSKKLIPDKPLDCENESLVKITRCYTLEEIQAAFKQGIRLKCGDQAHIEITCCMVAQMLNIGRPLENGQYKCYSRRVNEKYQKPVNEPLLDCPLGKKGKDCQIFYNETFACKCLPDQFLSSEQNPSKCSGESRKPTWPKCSSTTWIHENEYQCSCSYSTAQDCEIDSRITNATCLLCKHKCENLTTIQAAFKQGTRLKCGDQAHIEITCCMVAQMLNFGRPPENGQYKCYSVSVNEPLLNCPLGKNGKDCQISSTETSDCRCRLPDRFISSGQLLSKCDDENRKSNQCLSSTWINGNEHRCICSVSSELCDNIARCSQQNAVSAQGRHPDYSCIILSLCMLFRVLQWWLL